MVYSNHSIYLVFEEAKMKMFKGKRAQVVLASRLATIIKNFSGGLALAIFAGFSLLINVIKNIFSPPQQTSPPLWVIILVAVIVIMMFKRKK